MRSRRGDLIRWVIPALLAGCGDAAVLQGVAEPEANRAVAALDQSGIAARKAPEEGGSGSIRFRVSVAPADVARSVTVLHGNGLPRSEEPGFVETFGAQPSLVQSASEERARAAQASAGELARTLESMDGVLDARVHLALPAADDRPLDGTAGPRPGASVLLRHLGPRPPIDEAAIRRLVAGGLVGMRPDDVSVVTVPRSAPAASEARLDYVGPIAVARGSASTLRMALGVTLGLNAALATALTLVVLRRRREEPAGGEGASAS
jgi:type III secretion protein J